MDELKSTLDQERRVQNERAKKVAEHAAGNTPEKVMRGDDPITKMIKCNPDGRNKTNRLTNQEYIQRVLSYLHDENPAAPDATLNDTQYSGGDGESDISGSQENSMQKMIPKKKPVKKKKNHNDSSDEDEMERKKTVHFEFETSDLRS